MSWEDDLQKKLKTPEQKQAEEDRKKREKHAEGVRAASQALSEIRGAFLKAQRMLAAKYGQNMGVTQTGEDSSFEFPGHKLSAARSADGTGVIFTCDGKETRFVHQHGSTFAADGVVPASVGDFDEFVGRQITLLVQ